MKNEILELGQLVIVNTGGKDVLAIIDVPIHDVHGHYWDIKPVPSYLCRYTTDIKKTIHGGGKIHKQGEYREENTPYVVTQSNYIPANYITPIDSIKKAIVGRLSEVNLVGIPTLEEDSFGQITDKYKVFLGVDYVGQLVKYFSGAYTLVIPIENGERLRVGLYEEQVNFID
jgi:hypothetical protein